MTGRVEIRDGQEFHVTVLPPVNPPKKRSAKTRFRFVDVDKPGDLKPEGRKRKHGSPASRRRRRIRRAQARQTSA